MPTNQFFVLQDTDREVATFLNRKFTGLISSIETLPKEDLDLVSDIVVYVFLARNTIHNSAHQRVPAVSV